MISWLLHQGIVRVLSVPIAMLIAVYVTYLAAAPEPWSDDQDGEPRTGT